MKAVQRKRVLSIAILGTLLTLVVLAAEWRHKLMIPERVLDDFRVQYFQYFQTPPTDKLLHIDIDDGALAQIGRWPWSRSRIASLIDELNRAGAKAIVLDILFSEPTNSEGSGGAEQDQELADAIARSKNVILAASLSVKPPGSRDPLIDAMVGELTLSVEMTPQELTARLREKPEMPADLDKRVSADFLTARVRAMTAAVARELDRGPADSIELIERLLPKSVAANAANESPLLVQFGEAYAKASARRAIRRFALQAPADLPSLVVAEDGQLPIAAFSEKAPAAAFVNYLPETDGKVRCVPLAMWFDGRVMPQVSLAAACLALDADVHDLRIGADEVVIPRPAEKGGDVRVPTRAYPIGVYAGLHAFFDIPVFGRMNPDSASWETLYDYPSHEKPARRLSVMKAIGAAATRKAIENITLQTLFDVLSVLYPDQAKELAQELPTLSSEQVGQKVLDTRESFDKTLAQLQNLADAGAEEKHLLAELLKARPRREALDLLARQDFGNEILQSFRKEVEGRVVFVGSVATSAPDFVPTSIDPRCPGVYMHSAAFNAIMSRTFWHVAPAWVTRTLIVAFGLLTTLAVAALSPPKAFVTSLAMAGGYAAVNGLVLFDKYNWLVGAAAPLLVIAVVWSGITLIQFIREIGERTRLTKRFSSYVDPTLVNYVIENPEQARLDAHQKELTVVFTDLAGFTTLSEKIGPRSAKVLSEFMELMVPLIRARRGYVNKFLGDGIMFFFGAPVENPNHAADAIAAILDMQRAMGPFNEKLIAQDLPTLSMRVGISTGLMVVGDAGPSFASDYTVLGDAVNLAARLEGANKAFGTSNLITGRTLELIGDGKYLFRPVANVLVVGKEQSVIVHEVLAPAESATEEQKTLARLSREMFDAFAVARFGECLTVAMELERAFGSGKLVARYVEEANARNAQPADPQFKGQIQLFAK